MKLNYPSSQYPLMGFRGKVSQPAGDGWTFRIINLTGTNPKKFLYVLQYAFIDKLIKYNKEVYIVCGRES
jgi:hypothetical protein